MDIVVKAGRQADRGADDGTRHKTMYIHYADDDYHYFHCSLIENIYRRT